MTLDYSSMSEWLAGGIVLGYAFGWLLCGVNALFRVPLIMGGDN